jgi:hypothetical protein
VTTTLKFLLISKGGFTPMLAFFKERSDMAQLSHAKKVRNVHGFENHLPRCLSAAARAASGSGCHREMPAASMRRKSFVICPEAPFRPPQHHT